MTYRELQQFKMRVYRDFIEQQYGKKEAEKLELAIKSKITDKVLEIRDEKEFDEALISLRDNDED